MSETEQKLRSLLGEALGTLRAIESTYDDDELRERAGEAYIDLQNRMPDLAAAPQAHELPEEQAEEIDSREQRIAELESALQQARNDNAELQMCLHLSVDETASVAAAPQAQSDTTLDDLPSTLSEVWDAAMAHAAMYVEHHCVDGEMHADAIVRMGKPVFKAAAPQAHVTATEWQTLSTMQRETIDRQTQRIAELEAAPQAQPVARVTGYVGGKCTIVATDPTRLFNYGTALYAAPQAQEPADSVCPYCNGSGLMAKALILPEPPDVKCLMCLGRGRV